MSRFEPLFAAGTALHPLEIALIEYQKETKPQVNLKETLSQVNNINKK